MAKRKKYKGQTTIYKTYTQRSSNTNSTKNRWWTQVLRNGRQFLLHQWHPSCYSSYNAVGLICEMFIFIKCCSPFCYFFLISCLCSVRLYLELFVGGLMSYLHYLSLFVYISVQHILCCVFGLFVFVLCTLCCQFFWIVHFWLPFVLCTLCCQFLWIVHFWLPLQYSLTFIYLSWLIWHKNCAEYVEVEFCNCIYNFVYFRCF